MPDFKPTPVLMLEHALMLTLLHIQAAASAEPPAQPCQSCRHTCKATPHSHHLKCWPVPPPFQCVEVGFTYPVVVQTRQ